MQKTVDNAAKRSAAKRSGMHVEALLIILNSFVAKNLDQNITFAIKRDDSQ